MQKILLIIAYVLTGFVVKAQTFNGTGGTVPGTSAVQTCFPITVSGVGVINDISNGLSGVCISMTHPFTDELEIVLKAPDGTSVPLTVQNGGSGNNYTNTCFSATSANPIKFGNAPFTGTFEPEGYLGAVNNGQNADGTWRLCVQDRRTGANAGTLNSWSITFSNTPAPQPPAFPACANTLPANSSCANATAVCDFNGLCGNTSGSSVQDWSGSGLASCFGLQNNSFLKFIAAGTSASFTVWVPTNTGGSLGGIQMLFFSGNCNSGAVTTHGCYPHIYPYQSASSPVATIITASGLTPGNTYFLMFDGFNNDISTFRIAAKSGVNFLNINPAAPAICKGKSVNLTASGSDGTYTWSPSTDLNTTSGAVVTAGPLNSATYTVSSTTSTGCNLTADVIVTVNDTPVVTTHPTTAIQKICQNGPVIPFTVVASAGSGTLSYQWYITTNNNNTSGVPLPFATFPTFTPSSSNIGTIYFYCRVTNSNGCTTTSNVSGAFIVSAPPPIPGASTTVQPTCAVPTGTITVSSPTGTRYEYSVGSTYQTGLTFAGLSPSTTYNVTVRDTITGCVSAVRTVAVGAVPTEAAPTVSETTAPTCALPTGTVTVSLPLGSNYEYSSGGPYQASPVLSGLNPGSHNVTVRNNTTGCISVAASVTVSAVPTEPAPVASVTTQPTCTTPTGTITVSSPVGANYEYRIDNNAFQSSRVFSGLTNSTSYNIIASNLTTGCLSNPLVVTIGAIAGAPPTPAITALQTGCTNATGAITVTTPVGVNFEYSIGSGYQVGTSFSNLPAGTSYQVTVRDIFTGCVSAPLDTSMDAIQTLAPPLIPQPQIPYCQNTTAVPLTATGTDLLWYNSLTGGTGSSTAPTPITTATGTFKFYVSQSVGSCESPRDSITVTVTLTPALPGVTGNTTTYCENETATILTATGTNLQWYDVATGGSPLPGAPTPNTAGANNTTYYVSQAANGCESGRAPIAITVNAAPPSPTIAEPNVQYCHNAAANPLTATGTNLQWYDVAFGGTAVSTAPTPSTANTGSTFYYVSQTVNGCESGRDLITVTILAVATPPIVTTPVEYCQNQTATALTATGVNLQWYTTLTSATAIPAPIPSTNTIGSTKYYVSQLINTCESKRDSITVTIKPASQAPTVNSPLEYCQNTIAPQLTATGTNLLWYDAATGGSGSSTAPTPVTTTASTTFFYVTQNTNGCESTPRTAITVSVKLTSTAVSGFRFARDTVCLNGLNPSPSFDPGFTTGGTFVSTPAGLTINAATGDINLLSSDAGSYNITYTYITTGCVIGSTASDSITLNPAIPIELRFSYNSPVCKDVAPVLPQTFAGFTAGGAFTAIPGDLSINAGSGEINIGNSPPGTYTIIYNIVEQGCRQAGSRSAGITIIDTTSPVTKFTYSAADICITGGAVNPTISKETGFTAGGIFSVTPSTGLNVNSATGDVNIGLSVPGTYTIKYSVPSLLCRKAGSDSIVFRLRTYGTPVTGFSYVGPVCKGDTNAVPVLDAGFTDGGIYSTVTAGLVIDSITGIIDLVQSTAGNHTIQYDAKQGVCNPAGSGQANIVVLAQPATPTVTSASVCGEGNVTLTASALGAINWYTEPGLINQVNIGTSFTTFINSNTAYYVTNKIGACESEAAVANAAAYPIPAKPNLGGDTSICPNEKLVLNAGTYNSYLWQDGSANSTYNVTSSGLYKVVVSTGVGCSDSAAINVVVLDDCNDIVFPNAFAPGGYNKTFGALGNLFPISNYTLRIFNRYGQEVFVTSNPLKKWDGTFLGKPVNIGTYVYVATYLYKNKTDRVKKGTVTVIR